MNQICPDCKKPFKCGVQSKSCWCARLPRVLPVADDNGCRCPECVERMIEKAQDKGK